ncbi:hypothetical protein CSA17_06340 [bacterium DOLJORAL78_65_58]|nr:MAG: hypothetical protein CSA17_06340 [bacterium DOLJORAL78_65_58]
MRLSEERVAVLARLITDNLLDEELIDLEIDEDGTWKKAPRPGKWSWSARRKSFPSPRDMCPTDPAAPGTLATMIEENPKGSAS